MGVLTDDGANKLLDAALGAGHGSSWPATVYLAMSTTDPAITLTEPVGGAYARKAIPNDATNWAAAFGRQKVNALALTFPTATGSWGTLGYIAIMDAATGGLKLATDQLTVAASVVTGDTLTVPAGGIVLTC